ncbi:acanthoscurrin-1-like [Xyrichtys novacula]|uniref:Acanthoscurrin-1-like n=1 Tax=Xyrichtys novacula TaxID=13765 RepID=A0AAV1F7K1_XYRNO|nr:acanthoscurrin-1-like [Xyrichtys novacula]
MKEKPIFTFKAEFGKGFSSFIPVQVTAEMRVVLILCLLIGSVFSSPVWKEQGSGTQELAATSHMVPSYPASGRVESAGLGSSSSLPGLVNPGYVSSAGLSTYGSSGGYSGPALAAGSTGVGGFGAAYPPSSGYDSSASGGGYGGAHGGYGYASAPGGAGWNSGSTSYYAAGDSGDGGSEPIFSDVSDLDPVYAFSSRSRYQRGRAVFAQSRYTPGEALVQPMPEYRPVIKNPVMINIPVQEPVKTMPVKAAPQMQVQAQSQGSY